MTPVALGLVLSACGAERRETGLFDVIDSAGIEIADNAMSLSPEQRWRIVAGEPETVLTDGVSDSVHLFGVAGAHHFESGEFVVANRGTMQLLVFGESGDFQQRHASPPLT